MGQRTCILLKKTYKDKATISLLHHQWGYGKVMPSLFIQELFRHLYPLNRRAYDAVREGSNIEPIDIDFTFEPLNNAINNYITCEVVDRDLDVFSIPVLQKYSEMTDNNNGGMIIEVIQKYDNNGKPNTYGDVMDVKIGFALGYEETHYYHDKLDNSVPIEDEFGRILSAREYMTRTLTQIGSKLPEGEEEFVKYFEWLCGWVGVEQICDKEAEKQVQDRLNTIIQTVEGLTCNLKDNETIPVPKELIGKVQTFA